MHQQMSNLMIYELTDSEAQDVSLVASSVWRINFLNADSVLCWAFYRYTLFLYLSYVDKIMRG